ncbi:MAG: phosphate uptake regulator PhoU [archaeon]
MELRKVQSTSGGATHIVSLPRHWIKKNKLKQSDEIGIIERKDGILFLLPSPYKKKRVESYIDAENKDQNFLLRMIISEYIRGADIIKFKNASFSWKDKKEIREFIQNAIIGLDLNEHGESFEIHSIIDVYDLDIEKIIMRIYDLVRWMFTNSFQAIEKKDADLLIEIIGRDIEVDRLTLLASRQMHLAAKSPEFAEKIGISGYDALYYKILINDLESAGDCSVNISESYLKLVEQNIPKDLIKSLSILFGDLKKNLQVVIDSFTNENLYDANDAIEECTRLAKYDLSASGKSRFITDKRITHDSLIVGSFAIILENLARINNLTRSIAEIVIDRGKCENDI